MKGWYNNSIKHSIASKGIKTNIVLPITPVLRNIVLDVLENTEEELNNNEGNCFEISEKIKIEFDKLGLDSTIMHVTSGKISGSKEIYWVNHYFVVVNINNKLIVVDTQLWQIGLQSKDVKKRRVIFNWGDYMKYFEPIDYDIME